MKVVISVISLLLLDLCVYLLAVGLRCFTVVVGSMCIIRFCCFTVVVSVCISVDCWTPLFHCCCICVYICWLLGSVVSLLLLYLCVYLLAVCLRCFTVVGSVCISVGCLPPLFHCCCICVYICWLFASVVSLLLDLCVYLLAVCPRCFTVVGSVCISVGCWTLSLQVAAWRTALSRPHPRLRASRFHCPLVFGLWWSSPVHSHPVAIMNN